jgi:hypothetical protein
MSTQLPLTPVEKPLTAAELERHPDALHRPFKESGLWRQGYTFDQAISVDAIRRCLAISAEIKAQRDAYIAEQATKGEA